MRASPYHDLDRPPLSAEALRRALLRPGTVWRRLDLRQQTGSTNADVAAAARAGEPEGFVVVAERQAAGRGRRERRWVSPARAGLTFSVLLRPGLANDERGWPAIPARAYAWLPLLAGVAVLSAVRRLAEVDAVLKWPNDLLVRTPDGARAKCAGVLAEVADSTAVVVGIGLNVTTKWGEFPADAVATSLAAVGAATTDRDPLLKAMLRGLDEHYGRWRAVAGDADASGLRAAYRQGCATIGQAVRVLLPQGGELTGDAVDVDADGRLVVRDATGEHRVAAGDVVHVR